MSFKKRLRNTFSDRWNNLTQQGKHDLAYDLFMKEFPKFQMVGPPDRMKLYEAGLERLGLIVQPKAPVAKTYANTNIIS